MLKNRRQSSSSVRCWPLPTPPPPPSSSWIFRGVGQRQRPAQSIHAHDAALRPQRLRDMSRLVQQDDDDGNDEEKEDDRETRMKTIVPEASRGAPAGSIERPRLALRVKGALARSTKIIAERAAAAGPQRAGREQVAGRWAPSASGRHGEACWAGSGIRRSARGGG